MGQKVLPKKERNDKLIKDLQSGKYQISELIAKYKISQARIYQIKDSYEKKL